MRRLFSRISLFAAALAVMVTVACVQTCMPGTSLVITGPPDEVGYWASTTIGSSLACSGTCTLHTAGPFALDATGRQTIPNVLVANVGNSYSAIGANNSCMGTISWNGANGCPQTLDLPCNPVAVGGAHGDAAINGVEQVTTISGHPIWNGGTVSITMNGQTVSASYGRYSTPESVALDLAAAIEGNPTLSAEFASAGVGSDTQVAALSAGTQYDYPWQASCTYNRFFSSCSFWVTLQPSGSLTTQ